MEEKKFFNFNSDEKFDLNTEYTTLFEDVDEQKISSNDNKIKDAEKIISETGQKYIESKSLQKYENLFTNLDIFLNRFQTDSEEVKSMTKEHRDKLFGYGRELFSAYQTQYSSLNFNFELSMKEWNYMDNILTKKLSYNGNELFNFWELFTKFIEPTRNYIKDLPKNIESFIPICSIQSLVLVSHLLMKHEEKGSTDHFFYFKNVLTEVGQMTRLFNAYGVILERYTNMFNNWVDALNAMDGYNNIDRIDETSTDSQQ